MHSHVPKFVLHMSYMRAYKLLQTLVLAKCQGCVKKINKSFRSKTLAETSPPEKTFWYRNHSDFT